MNAASDKIVLELPSDLLTPKEAAAILGVTPTTVVRWVRAGRLPGYHLFRSYRVSRAEVIRFAKPVAPTASAIDRQLGTDRPFDVVKANAIAKGIL